MVKDFSAWANAWNDYSRSDVNYLVFVVGGTAALVVLALSLLLESNGTVLTFFCGLAVIVTLAGIWVVNFYPIWMEDSPEPAVFTTQVEKEFGVRNLSMLGGIVFLFHQIGSFLGGWLGGYLYDTTGSYDLVWQIAIGLSVMAAALNWPVREVPVARLQGAPA